MSPLQQMWHLGIKYLKDKKGMILPMLLSYALVYSMVVGGMVGYSSSVSRSIGLQRSDVQSFYMAEAGVEKGLAQIRKYFNQNGYAPSSDALDSMGGLHVGDHFSFTSGGANPVELNYMQAGSTTNVCSGCDPWSYTSITQGTYSGLNARVANIRIRAQVTNTQGSQPETTTMSQLAQIQMIPVFQFGVFYQNDLEILPGATMTFAGPVHTNADLYLGTHASLTFDSTLTAHGELYHGRKDSDDNMAGDVFVKDSEGINANMLQDGDWFDSLAEGWQSGAMDLWDGNVKDSSHGVQSLNIPLPIDAGSRTLIERRDAGDSAQVVTQKLDYKAQIRIIDGTIKDQAGNSLDFRYCQNSSGGSVNTNINTNGTSTLSDDTCVTGTHTLVNPFSTTSYRNYREGNGVATSYKTIQAFTIDIAKLKKSPRYTTIAASTGGNGVVMYHSDRTLDASATSQAAVRLDNGSALPTGGLTVASENPLYIKGDYNTVNKQPSGVIADAFNVLSNQWSNTNNTFDTRIANNTTVQTAVIAGNTNTNPETGVYNGGLENFPRFLEQWGSKTLTFKGSIVCLYNSARAIGKWTYGTPFYTAPNRDWRYDTDFSNPNYTIPGFPSVYTIVKSSWRVE